jgi:hypothetical protein
MTRPAADSADRLPEVDNRVNSPGAFDPGVRAVLAALHQEVRRVSWIATRTPNVLQGTAPAAETVRKAVLAFAK